MIRMRNAYVVAISYFFGFKIDEDIDLFVQFRRYVPERICFLIREPNVFQFNPTDDPRTRMRTMTKLLLVLSSVVTSTTSEWAPPPAPAPDAPTQGRDDDSA